MRATSLHAAVLVSLVGGLAFSLFAMVETIDPALQSACSVNPFLSCHAVATSGRTTTLGVEDWAWGVGGYGLLLGLDVAVLATWRRDLLGALLLVSALGVGLSAYFAYVELALIQALCVVCLGAYAGNGIAFVILLGLWRMGRTTAPRAVSSEPTAAAASLERQS